MDIRCGILKVDDDGILSILAEDGWEDIGHVEDPDSCPCEYRDDYACLLDRWRDAPGGGHRREAIWTYETMCRTSMN